MNRMRYLGVLSALVAGCSQEGMGRRAPATSPPVAAAEPVQEEEIEEGASGSVVSRQDLMGAPGSAFGGRADALELDEAKEQQAPGRSWFPETFLFEPLVVTDDAGAASVPVKVPDRLTRWRVLALAHSRTGAQAGAVSSFASVLPSYVDLVVPPFLRAGDVVRLPVQVVNTTPAAITRALQVEARGATVEGGTRTVTVSAGGSVMEYLTLRAPRPGPVTLRAELEGVDAVERTFDVWPTGRRVSETRGGTLAAPHALELVGPTSPQAGSERVRVLVLPGALGVLRSELASAPGRDHSGLAETAYTLLLAGRAPALIQGLGGTVDAPAAERTSRLASQWAMQAARGQTLEAAIQLAEAARAHPEDLVLARLGERLSAQVAQAQRPDGTCLGGQGWTLQRVLVATADCTRAVRAGTGTDEGRLRAMAFGARASGAFERSMSRVRDGYTAAAALASGGVTGSVREQLRTRVREALKKRPDGTAYLPVDPGVVRADGRAPSEAEATALAVLALVEDKEAPLAELGTALLTNYRPESGWGDGRTNLLSFQAALALFREPLPAQVRVVLERDGQPVTEGTFDTQALREGATLEADAAGSAGAHTWTVRSEPAVPGLGFTLTLGAYVPWQESKPAGGMELKLQRQSEPKLGGTVETVFQGSAPAGVELTLRQELPAGVQVDASRQDDSLRQGGQVRYKVEDGAVIFTLPARPTDWVFQVSSFVTPTLAGTLQGGAASLSPTGRADTIFVLPPKTWTLR